MTIARVSNVEAFRRWKNWQPLFEGQEEPTVEDLVRSITVDEPSEAMKAGTAFHKALELAQIGSHDTFEVDGYTFVLPDAELALPSVREMRAFGTYGGLTVTGQVDAVEGKIVTDHKTTSRFDAERYLNGCQYKFYLDLFGADEFLWNVFEIKEIDPLTYRVSEPQTLRACRYPEMHSHCEALAAEYLDFARKHLREETPQSVRMLMAG